MLIQVALEAFKDWFGDLVGLGDAASDTPQSEAPNVLGTIVDCHFAVVAGAKIIDMSIDEVLKAELDFIDGRKRFTVAFLGHGFTFQVKEAEGLNESGF
jgi:hypothetical protein